MVTIHVCIGSACHLKGAYNVIDKLNQLIESGKLTDKIEIKAALCLGKCTEAVSARVNEEERIISITEKNVEGFFKTEVLSRF
ncbi:MAG: (2Fe-2S) ferredoxin domain-containing protein [Clostridiaceae bacterium]|jgi:NADH:ubiquinone oxidoreductase subunit E|nr:(2Fe-2S) ferredoxin domain-containing protein [Clostridiaceae bacterium]